MWSISINGNWQTSQPADPQITMTEASTNRIPLIVVHGQVKVREEAVGDILNVVAHQRSIQPKHGSA